MSTRTRQKKRARRRLRAWTQRRERTRNKHRRRTRNLFRPPPPTQEEALERWLKSMDEKELKDQRAYVREGSKVSRHFAITTHDTVNPTTLGAATYARQFTYPIAEVISAISEEIVKRTEAKMRRMANELAFLREREMFR